MCRWIGFVGKPVPMEALIVRPEHSLIDQSLASREGAETTNGDGFGVGWYGEDPEAGLYKSVEPAWNDRNLAELSRHISSGLFLAHVRATTGTPIQRTNCHPFRNGRWIFVHNGLIRGYPKVRRELAMAVDPSLFFGIEGTTDSELMFNLALTFGLDHDPITALERMTGFVEATCARHGVEHPIQMTLGLCDGARLYAVRYSSEGSSRSLYHSKNIDALHEVYPAGLGFTGHCRAVVSEPLTEMSELWERVPESSALIVEGGEVDVRDFVPRATP